MWNKVGSGIHHNGDLNPWMGGSCISPLGVDVCVVGNGPLGGILCPHYWYGHLCILHTVVCDKNCNKTGSSVCILRFHTRDNADVHELMPSETDVNFKVKSYRCKRTHIRLHLVILI